MSFEESSREPTPRLFCSSCEQDPSRERGINNITCERGKGKGEYRGKLPWKKSPFKDQRYSFSEISSPRERRNLLDLCMKISELVREDRRGSRFSKEETREIMNGKLPSIPRQLRSSHNSLAVCRKAMGVAMK